MKDQFKSLVKKYLIHFSYFYSHLRHRVFVALFLNLSVGVMDGFGLAMFLPLLQMTDGENSASAEDLGGLSFLVKGVESLGIELTIASVLVVISVFFILKGIFKFLESYYTVLVQQYFIKKLRYDNVEKLTDFSYKSFVLTDNGKIQNTLSGEVGRVSSAYLSYFASIQFGVLVFVYIILAFLTNPQFAALVAVGGGISNLSYNKIYKKTKESSVRVTKGGHVFQGLLIQMVSFFKYLKATGFLHSYGDKLRNSIDYIENNNKKIGFYNSILVASREPMVVIVVVLVIMVQVYFFSERIGFIVLSLLFFYRSLNSLVFMQSHWNRFLNNSGSLLNMKEFMEELDEGKDVFGDRNFESFKNEIVLKDAHFSYMKYAVLKGVSLTIEKNKAYALIGESGSGKTTLINIISGLFPLSSGTIKVDGIDYSELNINSFSKRIGYITQEPVIFTDTVFNNVTGWAKPTEENLKRFWDALDRAAILDFVKELPEHENSELGANGVMVSGGQKQRISIARELYKNIDILILDEATSALDSETERIVQENIEALKGKFTLLIVAHRLSTIKSADVVFVLEKGKLTGKGAYEELLKNSGTVQRMVELQDL